MVYAIVAFEGPNGMEACVQAIHNKSEFTKAGKEDMDSKKKYYGTYHKNKTYLR